ncbi:hypothetical protein [Azotosporobacter soli]|uniref:hypothetical protein n=1 Tax=Azotosporobacter soli TaxID=3055040 RepID=UPI0031FE5389
MRACSWLCFIGVLFTIVDQFYSGINWMRLFLGGLAAVAVWTDCERWLQYKLRKKKTAVSGAR